MSPPRNPAAAMIFAAGLGTRMGELTRDRPKPLIPVAGQPLLAHALALVREAGIARVVVNIHAHAAMMRDWLAAHAPEVRVSEEAERLETGGGLRRALPLLGEGPVYTLNADMVWRGPNPLLALGRAWAPEAMDGLLAVLPRAAAVGHAGPGDFFRDGGGRVARRGAAAAAPYVYAGAGILDPEVLSPADGTVFSLNPVWDRLIAAGRLHGLPWHGVWADVGRPEGIALAEAELAR